MANWKTNKMVGVAAGVILILSIVLVARMMTAKPKPAAPETPFRVLVPQGGVK